MKCFISPPNVIDQLSGRTRSATKNSFVSTEYFEGHRGDYQSQGSSTDAEPKQPPPTSVSSSLTTRDGIRGTPLGCFLNQF